MNQYAQLMQALGQSPAVMGQGTMAQIDPYQAQYELEQARIARQRAEGLQQPIPQAGSPIGAIATLARAYIGRKREQEASEREKLAIGKLGQFERQQAAQADQQKKLDAEEAERKRIEYYRKQKEIDAEYAQPKDARTTLQKNLEAAGISPDDPRYQEAILASINKPGSTVNVNQGPEYTPIQNELAKKNAADYAKWRDEAVQARGTMDQLGALQEISNLQQTGKFEQAKALIGQYFGSEAGANMQAYNAISSRLVLDAAEKMKGALSDRDINFLKETAPQFGNDPRANQMIMQILNSAAEKTIGRFQDADSYLQENSSLQGFSPSFVNVSRETPAPQGAPPAQQFDAQRTIGGKNYVKIGDQWYEQ